MTKTRRGRIRRALEFRPKSGRDTRDIFTTVSRATSYFAFFGLDRISFFHTLGIFHMSFGLAPAIGLLIYCCAMYENVLTRALRTPWLVLCGEASYSLYLLHIIAVECFPRSIPYERMHFHAVLTLGVCLIACVGVSIVSWRLLEMPARNVLRSALAAVVQRGLRRSETMLEIR